MKSKPVIGRTDLPAVPKRRTLLWPPPVCQGADMSGQEESEDSSSSDRAGRLDAAGVRRLCSLPSACKDARVVRGSLDLSARAPLLFLGHPLPLSAHFGAAARYPGSATAVRSIGRAGPDFATQSPGDKPQLLNPPDWWPRTPIRDCSAPLRFLAKASAPAGSRRARH